MHKMMHPSSWKKKGAENNQLWLTFIIYIYIYIYIYKYTYIHISFFWGGEGVTYGEYIIRVPSIFICRDELIPLWILY